MSTVIEKFRHYGQQDATDGELRRGGETLAETSVPQAR